MSAASRKEAHDYAERIRARLARRLELLFKAKNLNPYRLEDRCGISRVMIGRVLKGESKKVSFVVMAQMSHGMDMMLKELSELLEDDSEP